MSDPKCPMKFTAVADPQSARGSGTVNRMVPESRIQEAARALARVPAENPKTSLDSSGLRSAQSTVQRVRSSLRCAISSLLRTCIAHLATSLGEPVGLLRMTRFLGGFDQVVLLHAP